MEEEIGAVYIDRKKVAKMVRKTTEDFTDYGSPVRLKERTKRELRKYGQFGESYDDLIWKLIKSYKLALKLKAKKEK